MRGASLALAAFPALAALAACDTMPAVALYNGVGRTLEVSIAKGGRPSKTVRLQPGSSMTIWNIYGPELTLTTEGCVRRYELPFMAVNHPWRIADGHGGSAADYSSAYPLGC